MSHTFQFKEYIYILTFFKCADYFNIEFRLLMAMMHTSAKVTWFYYYTSSISMDGVVYWIKSSTTLQIEKVLEFWKFKFQDGSIYPCDQETLDIIKPIVDKNEWLQLCLFTSLPLPHLLISSIVTSLWKGFYVVMRVSNLSSLLVSCPFYLGERHWLETSLNAWTWHLGFGHIQWNWRQVTEWSGHYSSFWILWKRENLLNRWTWGSSGRRSGHGTFCNIYMVWCTSPSTLKYATRNNNVHKY